MCPHLPILGRASTSLGKSRCLSAAHRAQGGVIVGIGGRRVPAFWTMRFEASWQVHKVWRVRNGEWEDMLQILSIMLFHLDNRCDA